MQHYNSNQNGTRLKKVTNLIFFIFILENNIHNQTIIFFYGEKMGVFIINSMKKIIYFQRNFTTEVKNYNLFINDTN